MFVPNKKEACRVAMVGRESVAHSAIDVLTNNDNITGQEIINGVTIEPFWDSDGAVGVGLTQPLGERTQRTPPHF